MTQNTPATTSVASPPTKLATLRGPPQSSGSGTKKLARARTAQAVLSAKSHTTRRVCARARYALHVKTHIRGMITNEIMVVIKVDLHSRNWTLCPCSHAPAIQ